MPYVVDCVYLSVLVLCCSFLACSALPVFFFNDTATTEIYTLSLHDALPIWDAAMLTFAWRPRRGSCAHPVEGQRQDRKSTRLNSSHLGISYAVFCLKKKKKKNKN